MRVIETTIYVSDDGCREFKNPDECIEYEKFVLLRAIILKRAPNIVYDTEVANFILAAWGEIELAMRHKA